MPGVLRATATRIRFDKYEGLVPPFFRGIVEVSGIGHCVVGGETSGFLPLWKKWRGFGTDFETVVRGIDFLFPFSSHRKSYPFSVLESNRAISRLLHAFDTLIARARVHISTSGNYAHEETSRFKNHPAADFGSCFLHLSAITGGTVIAHRFLLKKRKSRCDRGPRLRLVRQLGVRVVTAVTRWKMVGKMGKKLLGALLGPAISKMGKFLRMSVEANGKEITVGGVRSLGSGLSLSTRIWATM